MLFFGDLQNEYTNFVQRDKGEKEEWRNVERYKIMEEEGNVCKKEELRQRSILVKENEKTDLKNKGKEE